MFSSWTCPKNIGPPFFDRKQSACGNFVDSIIQLPSANPPPCPGRGIDGSTKRSIGRSIDRSIPWMLGPFFRSSGGRCGTLGGSHIDPESMKNHRKSTPNRPKIVPKSTEIDPKPSKIAPRGRSGRPGGSEDEN